jgi:hypothetical protein
MAITRLWFFTLKSDISVHDPAFLSLWTNILELCATYSPSPTSSSGSGLQMVLSTTPRRSHHFLFQTAHDERLLVLISNYPSMALCRQADAAYSKRHKDEVLRLVAHRALRQFDIEDAEVVPALLEAAVRPGGGEVSVTFSKRDPLTMELVESRSGNGSRAPVPPPTEEISGPDSSEIPLIPGVDFGNILEARKSEGKKWISISRGKPEQQVDDEEVFRLTQVMAR